MKNKKTFKNVLSLIFIIVIIASIAIIVIDLIKPEEKIPEYETPPEEIIVDDDDKTVVEIDNKNSIKMSPDIDLDAERKKYNNSDIIGRLEIPDLFNILVVRGNDNKYYLNYSVSKKRDVRGSEFMDYRLTPTSKHINIYGHNSRDENVKVPFLRLEKFLNKDFFDKNPYIIFQYDSGKSVYKIISIKEITTDYEHMNFNITGKEFKNHIDRLVRNSIYTRDVSYDENSEIIVLQTCSHHLDNAYYIVTAIKIDYDES